MIEINRIYCGNCLKLMEQIEDESIDCVLTSPPYNIGMNYDFYNDNLNWDEYYNFINKWLEFTFRILKNSGRLIIVLPENKKEPIYQKIINLAINVGFNYHINIVWYKNKITNRSAWGSWLSPSAPMVQPPFEYITILYKGNYKKEDKIDKISDLTKKEFIEWTFGLWTIKDGDRIKGHPATFPIELPKRCIKLFTYVDDLILDTFCGCGSVPIMCKLLNRRFIGIELSKEYCDIANKRLAQEVLI